MSHVVTYALSAIWKYSVSPDSKSRQFPTLPVVLSIAGFDPTAAYYLSPTRPERPAMFAGLVGALAGLEGDLKPRGHAVTRTGAT